MGENDQSLDFGRDKGIPSSCPWFATSTTRKDLLSSAFRESVGTLNLIRRSVPLSLCLSVRLSVCLSVCHKNFNLAHIYWSINDRALIFGMHDPCDKSFTLVPCGDLDLWPTSRSNLLPGGGPQFFEFACHGLQIMDTDGIPLSLLQCGDRFYYSPNLDRATLAISVRFISLSSTCLYSTIFTMVSYFLRWTLLKFFSSFFRWTESTKSSAVEPNHKRRD